MRTNDIVGFSIGNLRHRKLRSWLTIIGIIIGVAAIVALVSIGQGLQQSVEKQLSGLGSQLVFITPGHSRAGGARFGSEFGGFAPGGTTAGNLTENDLRLIKTIPGVFLANGVINQQAVLKYISENVNINVQGGDPGLQQQFSTVLLEKGRFLATGDDRVAVIGYNVANDLFTKPIDINNVIFINGQSFRVVGILQQSGGMAQTDNLVIIPIVAARRVFPDLPKDQFSAMVIRVSDSANIDNVVSDIENKLLLSHHVTKDSQDFTVTSSQSILATIGQVTTTITLFLGGIAAISLLVGGIGIANTMFMSVMERTRQIGILKALGATYQDIMKLFLIESGLLGFLGGLIGVILGFVGSLALSGLRILGFGGGGAGVTTEVTWQLLVFALAFSTIVGIVSGLFPARRAAKLQPVEALRYE